MNATKKITRVDKTGKKRGRPQCFCRDDALAKALKLFCKKGYEATSVAELGNAMGMKPPSLYNAFGDKERLFLEVLDYYHKPYVETVRKILKEEDSTLIALHRVMDLSKEYHGRKNALGCLIVNSAIQVDAENSPIAEKLKQLHDLNENMLYTRLKKGQKTGEISLSVNIRSIARYINGILQGSAVLGRGQQSPTAVKDLIDTAQKSLNFMLIKSKSD